MGIKRIIVIFLSMGFCFTTFAQGSYVEEALTDIFTWFNPIVHNAYCQYPIKGSGKISNYIVVIVFYNDSGLPGNNNQHIQSGHPPPHCAF